MVMDARSFLRALAIYRKDWPTAVIDEHSALVGWNLRATSDVKPKEGGMEKLTRDAVWDHFDPRREGHMEHRLENFWKMIEADREAIRAETREELLKDRYFPGESVELLVEGRWVAGTIIARQFGKSEQTRAPEEIRRPPKKRSMTSVEMVEEIVKARLRNDPSNRPHYTRLADAWASTAKEMAQGRTPYGICMALNLPTEVDDE